MACDTGEGSAVAASQEVLPEGIHPNQSPEQRRSLAIRKSCCGENEDLVGQSQGYVQTNELGGTWLYEDQFPDVQ